MRTIVDDWEHFERAMRISSLADIETSMSGFARAHGFRHFAVAHMRHRTAPDPVFASAEGRAEAASVRASGGKAQAVINVEMPRSANDAHLFMRYHNLPAELGRMFSSLDRPEIARAEPRILQARMRLPPASWNSLGHSNYVPPADIRSVVRNKLMVTGELGLHSGITVPMHGSATDWAFLTFSSDVRLAPRELVPLLLTATYFSHCLQSSIERLQNVQLSSSPLSEREIECLRWSAIGKTSWETSLILRISERTVNFHLQRAAAKLGVKGQRAAVARAIATGTIRL